MDQTTRQRLVQQLTELLTQGHAHVPLEEAVAGLWPAVLNRAVAGLPYTIWQLTEHIRIAQWDIVEFCLRPEHQSPAWPEGYWPGPAHPADAQRWAATLAQIRHDRERFVQLLQDPAHDLLAPLPHGSGQSLLREAHLIADHTAYHTGQILLLRRLLRAWPPPRTSATSA